MRKIKFAGIAAATLLAISPVATNALGSSTQTVQAASDTSSSNVLVGFLEKAWDQVKQNIGTTDAGKKLVDAVDKMIANAKDAATDSDANKETAKDDVSKKAVEALQAIGKQDIAYDGKDDGTLDSLISLNDQDATATQLQKALFDAKAGEQAQRQAIKDADGKVTFKVTTGLDNQNLATTYNSFKELGNGFPLPFTIKATATDGTNLGSTTINFVNNKEVATVSTSLDISYTTPVHVDAGDSAVAQKLTTSVDAKVTNEKGETVKPSYTSLGNFYNSEADAYAQNSNVAGVGANFAGNGITYYQPVTLTFDKNAVNVGAIYNAMKKDGSQKLTLNGADAYGRNVSSAANSITYVREFQVGSGFDNNNSNNNNNENNNNTNTENGIWVEDSTIGTVQVKNSTASLYNDDNDITNRALAANSSWATDKSRVNSKTGLKQYHVSTHEWVNASDITFTSKDGNTNNNGSTSGLNNITNLQGYHAVKLDGPTGFVYALYSQNGTRSNRGLAGLTSWYTDKSATDNQGNTYYRVSTDEWVRASTGVTLN